MLDPLKRFFTKHLALKILSLILALLIWFYIVNELNKGSVEEVQMLRRMLPSEQLVTKKLEIKPVFIGKPHRGHKLGQGSAVITPTYCIVVGPRNMVAKMKFAYTMPIDIKRASKPFIVSIPLNPAAPGVYMEETLVQVTVPIEKEKGS